MAKRRLTPEMSSAIDQVLASDPELYDRLVPMVEERGFDSSTINRPSGVEGDMWDEAAAFLSGIPEGASYGLYEAESAGKAAGSVDVPILGDIQPSRELGRLLGGAVTGGALYGLGLKTLGRAAGRSTMKGLAKKGVGSKGFRKGVAKTVAAAGGGTPEAVVASVAAGIREGDLEAAAEAFPQWMALGLGSDALFTAAQKLYRRTMAGAKVPQADRERLARQVEEEGGLFDPVKEGTIYDAENKAVMDEEGGAGIIYDQPIGGEDAKRFNDIVDAEDPWLNEKIPVSAYGAEFGSPAEAKVFKRAAGRKISAALSESHQRARIETAPKPIHEPQQGPNGEIMAVSLDDQIEAMRKDLANDLRIQDKRTRAKSKYKGSKESNAFALRMQEKDRSLRNLLNERPRDPKKEYFKGLEVVRGPIAGGATARYVRGGEVIYIDDDLVDSLWERKGWRKSNLPAVKGYTSNAFKSREEVEEYVLKHEWMHSLVDFDTWKAKHKNPTFDKAEGRDDYENFINRMTHDFEAHVSKSEAEEKMIDDSFKMNVPEYDDPPNFSKQLEEKVGDAPKDNLPFEGGAGPTPVDLRAEIAVLMEDIRRKMPELHINPKILLPDNITLEQAAIVRDNLMEVQYWSDVMKHDRLAHQLEAEGPSSGIDDLPIDVQAAVEEVGEDIAQKPGNLSRIVGPFSRNGLGANRLTRWFAEETMGRMDEKQARLGKWLKEYLEIRKLVGMQDQGLGQRTANVARRALGGADPEEGARTKLYELARVLDGAEGTIGELQLPDWWDAGMKQAYQRYKAMMVEVADDLELPRNRRIGEYLHHLFAGRTGRYRATQLSSHLSDEPGKAGRLLKKILDESSPETKELELEQHVRDLLDSVQREAPDVTPRGFRALLKRKGAEGYEFDLDQITRIYLMGAAEKWFSNQIYPRAQGIMMHLPDIDLNGNSMKIRREFAEYVNHLMGRSTERRQKVAAWFGQSSLWNRGFDRMVEYLGYGKRGTLAAGRREADQGVEGESQAAAMQFLDELDEAARIYDKQTGERVVSKGMKAKRARLAIRLEDMRQAMANPGISGPVANQLYRVQIMSKLGLNMAHGLINTTQTYINTWPMLKKGYASKAIVNHWFKGSGRNIKGYDVDDLLEQSGIRGDAAKVEEYIELHGTWLGDFQNFVMAPSKMSEQFNRSVAFLGFYEQYRDEGLEHLAAMRKSVAGVQKTQFPFNRAGTPPMLRGPMVRLAFMFKSYPIHQTDFTANIARDAWTAHKAARQEGKSLVQALQEDDVMTLTKHIFSYISLLGAGYALFPETSLGERSGIPPAAGMISGVGGDVGRYGALGSLAHNLGGPFNETVRRGVMSADGALDYLAALAGLSDQSAGEAFTSMVRNGQRTAESFIEPTSVRKLRENGFPDNNDDWLQLLSLKKYEPRKPKPKALSMAGF